MGGMDNAESMNIEIGGEELMMLTFVVLRIV